MVARVVTAALAFMLASITAAAADDVRKWRDADGNLHYRITGSPGDPSETTDGPILHGRAATAEEAFSVDSSLRRREIETKLAATSRALDDTRAKIHEAQEKKFETWVPVVTGNPRAAQASIDAQRDAFLAAQQFDQEKTDTLRRLHRREREQLRTIVGLWKDFDALDAKVIEHYGKAPIWWRKRLDCSRCPTLAEADRLLHPASPTPGAEPRAADAEADDDEEGWDKAWE